MNVTFPSHLALVHNDDYESVIPVYLGFFIDIRLVRQRNVSGVSRQCDGREFILASSPVVRREICLEHADCHGFSPGIACTLMLTAVV